MAVGAIRDDVERRPGGPIRRASSTLHRHRGIQLGLTLGPPVVWMLVVYLAALVLLFLTSFWRVDPLTSSVVRQWGITNYREIVTESIYRTITLRTVGIAAAVTVADVALAFPLAYYAARIATARVRAAILLAVVLPLWSSYLVRVFAWRTILEVGGPAAWVLQGLGLGGAKVAFSNWAVWITFVYLWLPFVILPIYAAIERIPPSFLEASGDLGAQATTTFRKVIWPLAFPGVVAGSIFAFSLTLGDYITPSLVGNTEFIGNVISDKVGVAGDLPFAAAFAMVPVAIMAVYLTIAKRLGAFEAL
jgi:putative spermidine/putrescine transport system permease protein